MHRLRTDVFTHLHRQSIAFFTRPAPARCSHASPTTSAACSRWSPRTATSIASNLTTAIATAVAMAALSWRLSLISLVVLPPSIYLTRRVARMRRGDHPRSSANSPTSTSPSRRACRSAASSSRDMGTGPALVERFTASSARLIDLELRSELAGRWRMAR